MKSNYLKFARPVRIPFSFLYASHITLCSENPVGQRDSKKKYTRLIYTVINAENKYIGENVTFLQRNINSPGDYTRGNLNIGF